MCVCVCVCVNAEVGMRVVSTTTSALTALHYLLLVNLLRNEGVQIAYMKKVE